ncbi:MAG: hypothetical protein P8M30_02835 [Planctomycetaceae bacterium]|jgi:hypothetical protein|nr:hypothetical protein [Planctomycetaceae bacterium]
MARRNWDLNRKLTGWASLMCFVGWAICESMGYGEEIIAAGLVRNGLFLGALWLALPNNKRSAAWEDISWSSVMLVALFAMGFLAARYKWMAIPLVLGVVLALYFLRRPSKL